MTSVRPGLRPAAAGRPHGRAGRTAGFTLVELVVAGVLLGIVMTSAVGLLMSQRNLYSVQTDKIALQTNVRAAVDLVASELRTIPDRAVLRGKADSVTVRFPYRWGLVCGPVTPAATKEDPNPPATDADVYMPDVTDGLYVGHAQTGIGYRDTAGVWTFVDDTGTPWGDSISIAGTSACQRGPGQKLQLTDQYDKEGNLIRAADTAAAGYRRWSNYVGYTGMQPYRGAQVIAYSTVTYRFGPSGFEPGTRALFRVTSAGAQELSGMFAEDSSFEYVLENGQVYPNLPVGQENNVAEIRIKAFATKANQAGAKQRTLDYDATVEVVLRNSGEDQ